MATNPNDRVNPASPEDDDGKRPFEEVDLPDTEPMTHLPQPAVPPFPDGSERAGGSGRIPTAEPVSGTGLPSSAYDPDAAVGNLEPVSPISPASGWLDSDVPLPSVGEAPPAESLKVESADLFESPPQVESSDIFSTGGARPVEGSDVLAATAFKEGTPSEPGPQGRPSDVALNFDAPLGGSTIHSATGSGELPVAEEVVDPLFDSARHDALAAGDDSPDYGAVPEPSSDTSSILADLSSPGDITIDDSSAIRLEAPGMGRSTRPPSSATEFDLTIGEDEIPPELADAAAAAEGKAPPAGPRKSRPEPTHHDMDVDSGRVQPVDLRLRPDDPSSIFDSINDPVVFRKPGQTTPSAEDEAAAIEFTEEADEESGSDSSLFSTSRPRRPRPASSHDFELPAEPAGDSGVLGWTAPEELKPGGETSNILKRGFGKPSQPRTEPSDPDAATHAAPPLAAPVDPDAAATREGVELDWVAGSSAEQMPVEAAPVERTPAPRKVRSREKDQPVRPAAARGGPSRAASILLGMVVATTACAGVYFSGIIPNSQKVTAKGPASATPGTQPDPTAPGGQSPPTAAVPGQTRIFAKIQELAALNAGVAAAEDPDLKKAREELQVVADDTESAKTAAGERKAVEATIYIGVTHELAGDRAAARKVYEEAIQKFPKYRDTFQAALDRLDALAVGARDVSRGPAPAQAEALLLALVLLQDEPAAKSDPEAGTFFWKAVKAAGAGKYTEAISLIDQARAAHVKQAKAAPGRGTNPLSDPLEQIFPRCCDDLKAYWELRAALYSNKVVADLIKKDGAARAMAELERRASAAVKTMADLKNAQAQLLKANTDLKDAATRVATAESDLKVSQGELLKRTKDVEAAEKRLKEEMIARTMEATARNASDDARKKGDALIAALAKELQGAKLLPEKYDEAALLAAQKSAAVRATGPTLAALLPTGMMAVGGGGLSAGQLTDLAERLTRAEATAKAADARLAAETRRLRDEHTAEVKKLTDGYAADTKKLMENYTAGTTRLKDDHASEVKKMAEKFVADSKKLTETYEAKVKVLEGLAASEKAAAEAMAAKFKVDLGNAMSLAQALDVWLPLLTELRRPADADPALATATKVIATSPANSEDAAKAQTVAGMAHFLKGEMGKARELFTAALSSPAYRSAAGKPWARAAEIGRNSIDDPLALYRRPVELLKRDPKSAARFLDAGIKAYRAGRYPEASAALAESVKADDRDPIAWYYLGAARWATASSEQAAEAFQQGAERERVSPWPTRWIDAQLGPIQGAARDALTAARP